METTVSVHFGSKCCLEHNRREARIIRKENEKWARKYPGETRIQEGYYEILKDEGDLNVVYQEIFGEALQEFNEKQIKNGNKDRCIKNYLSEIRAKEGRTDKARHPLYELIVQVGSKDRPIEQNVAIQILKDYYSNFEARNPNLHVVMAALHADESTPHLHISVIPIAYHMNRGMRTQNSIKNALIQQGFQSESRFNNAQMQWEKSERHILEDVCSNYGFTEIMHPLTGKKAEHLSDEEFKLQKKIEVLQNQFEAKMELPLGNVLVKRARLAELEQLENDYKRKLPEIQQAKHDLYAASISMQAYAKAYSELQKDKCQFEQRVNEAANAKIKNLKDKGLEFIKSLGLWDKFLAWSCKIVESAKQGFHM